MALLQHCLKPLPLILRLCDKGDSFSREYVKCDCAVAIKPVFYSQKHLCVKEKTSRAVDSNHSGGMNLMALTKPFMGKKGRTCIHGLIHFTEVRAAKL